MRIIRRSRRSAQALTDAGFRQLRRSREAPALSGTAEGARKADSGFDEKRAGFVSARESRTADRGQGDVRRGPRAERRSKAAIEAYRAADQAVTKLDADCARLARGRQGTRCAVGIA